MPGKLSKILRFLLPNGLNLFAKSKLIFLFLSIGLVGSSSLASTVLSSSVSSEVNGFGLNLLLNPLSCSMPGKLSKILRFLLPNGLNLFAKSKLIFLFLSIGLVGSSSLASTVLSSSFLSLFFGLDDTFFDLPPPINLSAQSLFTFEL